MYEKVYVGNNNHRAGEVVGYDHGRVQIHFYSEPMDVIAWYLKEHIRFTGEFPCAECGRWQAPARQVWCDCPNGQRRRKIEKRS